MILFFFKNVQSAFSVKGIKSIPIQHRRRPFIEKLPAAREAHIMQPDNLLACNIKGSQYSRTEGFSLKRCGEVKVPFVQSIRVFDRGIRSRKIYDDWVEKGIEFITRIDARSKRQPVRVNDLGSTTEISTLLILGEEWVYLFGDKGRKSTFALRTISTLQKESGETLVFITNKTGLSAWEVAEIYRKRRKIETFFKFIKQELNFSHLINRSANGIEVMLYIRYIIIGL